MQRAILNLALSVVWCSLGACDRNATEGVSPNLSAGPPPLTAATLGEQTILSPKDYLRQDRYGSADIERGQSLAMQCRACHSLEQGGAAVVGPNLFGIFGRVAGSAPDFSYSEALTASRFVWTPRALDAWLAEPFGFLPGNRMTFPGLAEQSDRDAVIAFLLLNTGGANPE